MPIRAKSRVGRMFLACDRIRAGYPTFPELALWLLVEPNDWEEVPGMSMTGTVKFFNSSKGYGFITPDEGGKDVFVHISAVQQSGLDGLADGQRVQFETEPDRRGKGPQAVNIVPAD